MTLNTSLSEVIYHAYMSMHDSLTTWLPGALLYTDDTQLYFHDKAESCERRLPRFTKCIAAIES